MPEIEVKILDIDRNQVIAALQKRQAALLFSGLVLVRHYDFLKNRLRRAGKLIRVRSFQPIANTEMMHRQRPWTEVCFKGKRQVIEGMKVREEIQADVSDFDAMCTIFENMGMHCTLIVEKKRDSYALGQTHIDIDVYPGNVTYMEVEGPDAATIESTIRLLGLEKYPRSSETAEEYFSRVHPKVNFRDLRFE